MPDQEDPHLFYTNKLRFKLLTDITADCKEAYNTLSEKSVQFFGEPKEAVSGIGVLLLI